MSHDPEAGRKLREAIETYAMNQVIGRDLDTLDAVLECFVPDDESQREVRSLLIEHGLPIPPVSRPDARRLRCHRDGRRSTRQVLDQTYSSDRRNLDELQKTSQAGDPHSRRGAAKDRAQGPYTLEAAALLLLSVRRACPRGRRATETTSGPKTQVAGRAVTTS